MTQRNVVTARMRKLLTVCGLAAALSAVFLALPIGTASATVGAPCEVDGQGGDGTGATHHSANIYFITAPDYNCGPRSGRLAALGGNDPSKPWWNNKVQLIGTTPPPPGYVNFYEQFDCAYLVYNIDPGSFSGWTTTGADVHWGCLARRSRTCTFVNPVNCQQVDWAYMQFALDKDSPSNKGTLWARVVNSASSPIAPPSPTSMTSSGVKLTGYNGGAINDPFVVRTSHS